MLPSDLSLEIIVSPYVPEGTIVMMPKSLGTMNLTPEEKARINACKTPEERFIELGSILAGNGQVVIAENVGRRIFGEQPPILQPVRVKINEREPRWSWTRIEEDAD